MFKEGPIFSEALNWDILREFSSDQTLLKEEREKDAFFMTPDNLQGKLDSKHQKVYMEVEFLGHKKLQGQCCL